MPRHRRSNLVEMCAVSLQSSAMASYPLRIALWSGPRNLSTAMMRSFSSRTDTAVMDEPLYAHYLLRTGRHHPGAIDVITHHECDWRLVIQTLLGPAPNGKAVFYQKHM